MLSFLDRVTIRTRLIAVILGLLSLLVGLGVFAVDRLQAVNEVSTEINRNWMPSLAATAALDHGIGEYRLNVLQHVLSDAPDLMETPPPESRARQRRGRQN